MGRAQCARVMKGQCDRTIPLLQRERKTPSMESEPMGSAEPPARCGTP